MKYLFSSLSVTMAMLTALACAPPDQPPPTTDDQAASLVCLPVGFLCVPPLLGCCGDAVCHHGVCTDLCAGVTCTASDTCHEAGTCNPQTGICSNPIKADGAQCNDGNACTQSDVCSSGVCGGTNPCENGGTCATSGNAFTCTCTGGYTGTTCEIPPAPTEPTIGCHDAPANSGNTGTDDLFYLGPIDTVNNIRFFRAPRDGTCSGSSFQNGSALVSAASQAEANTKCQSLLGAEAFAIDGSIWDGVAGFWLCSRPPAG